MSTEFDLFASFNQRMLDCIKPIYDSLERQNVAWLMVQEELNKKFAPLRMALEELDKKIAPAQMAKERLCKCFLPLHQAVKDYTHIMQDIRHIVNVYMGGDVSPKDCIDAYLSENKLCDDFEKIAADDKFDIFYQHVGGPEKAMDYLSSHPHYTCDEYNLVMEFAWDIIKSKYPDMSKKEFDSWSLRELKRNLGLVTDIRT